jgi:tripartite ATP-independent transporter DctM subunit
MFAHGANPINASLQLYRGLDAFPILAVPFFLTVGILVEASSLGDRLLRLAALMVGGVRGSVGHINVTVSMLFAGISGAATADAAGIGTVMVPMMRKRGYSPEYAAAITGISAVIGAIIPPSVLMIIYGAYANVSIAGLFLGGVTPGVLLGLAYIAVNYIHCRRHNLDYGELDEVDIAGDQTGQPIGHGATVLAALPALILPILIIGGITGGIFTATEAGMAALLYVLLLTMVIYRDFCPRQLYPILRRSVFFYSIVLIAGGAATVFGWVLTLLGAPDQIEWLLGIFDVGWLGYMLVSIVILLIIGTFLDPFPAIIIFAPLFLTGAAELGVDPVHFGVVVVTTLAFGMVTPPYGLVLLIVSNLAGCNVHRAAVAMVPFWLATLAVILLVAAVPSVSLWLPELLLPDLFIGGRVE